MTSKSILSLVFLCCWSLPGASAGGATEFCLEGELDLGARYQGTEPKPGEFYQTTWCITTEDDTNRVFFAANGRSNPDIAGDWAVAYLPPDNVRVVDSASQMDIEFQDTGNLDEAMRVRRADPRRLLQELLASQEPLKGIQVEIDDDRVVRVHTSTELPLRGRVPVTWIWDWTNESGPKLRLVVDDELLYRASGRWRDVPDDEAAALWVATPGAELITVPGIHWPARVNMQLTELADGVYVVQGVRTGFRHLVVDTNEGLIVADAPAGWVEFHHIPPSDLVPGLGVSGLSEQFVDFLGEAFPDRPIVAVAITHFHDDHSGGARAFAAAGADVYAPGQSVGFLRDALNRPSMPADRMSGSTVEVLPVTDTVPIGSEPNRVKLVSIGAGPHSYAMLGVWAVDKGLFFVSDIHVPRSDSDSPRKGRAETECWFAEWAVGYLPPDVRVINSHSDIATPVARLDSYLESKGCTSL